MKHLFIVIIFTLFPSQLFAARENGVFSLEPLLVITTHEKVYIFNKEYVEIHLGKELSSTYFYHKPYNKVYQYSITGKYLDGETWQEFCLLLPEIGDWSISSVDIVGIDKTDIFIEDTVITLKCKIYESNDIIYLKYSPLQGSISVDDKGKIYISSTWYCEYYGNRPSTENICHIRYAKKPIYHKKISNKKFEILLVPDTYIDHQIRNTDHYDDLYFYHNDHIKRNAPADFTCFIVPRIFFVKFEEQSLSIDIMDDHSPIRFTIIVQQFENPEQTVWNYHRLEIIREESAHEIEINDLGPLPRSEWEPGWPDPATTPLWKEPKSECAECQ